MKKNSKKISDEQLINRLKFTAKRDGKDFADFVAQICDGRDKAIYDELLIKVNGDEKLASLLLEQIEKKAGGSIAEKPEPERDEKALENEFSQIKGEFTEFNKFGSLPDEIKQTALRENISLYDAILRYLYAQYKLMRSELERRRKNGAANIKLPKNSDGGAAAEIIAMLKGVAGK